MRGTDAAGWTLVLLISVPLVLAAAGCVLGLTVMIISAIE
jgi:hypothetical protein